jgi:hypothetical protein
MSRYLDRVPPRRVLWVCVGFNWAGALSAIGWRPSLPLAIFAGMLCLGFALIPLDIPKSRP